VLAVQNAFVGFEGVVFDNDRLFLTDPVFMTSFDDLCRTARGFRLDRRSSRARIPALLDIRWPRTWPPSDLHRHPRYSDQSAPDDHPIIESHGPLATIVHRYSGAYYHWLIEAVPRLLQLRKFLDKDPNLLLLVDCDEWAQVKNTSIDQYLRLLGIDLSRVVRYLPWKIYAADRVLLPGPVQSGVPVADRLYAVRRELLSDIRPSRPGCVIAIDRSRATCRRITNWPEVVEALRHTCRDREVIDFDATQMGVSDQVALFAGAAAVVGAHGAGLANTVFCNPAATIVEIIPAEYRQPGLCFARQARLLGISHHYYVADESGLHDDFCLAPDQLAAYVRERLAACPRSPCP
jgi:capsular polysaccharide biosynthesis protein